jgi:hypothetical protein
VSLRPVPDPLSGSGARDSRLARCVWEIDKHQRGDPRARYTLSAWIAELEAVLAEPDDGIRPNGPYTLDGKPPAPSPWDVR